MWRGRLTLLLLLECCFCLAAWLMPRHLARVNANEPSQSTLASSLGVGRKMVADYFAVQADVYFHSGYYPSVFEEARAQEEQESDISHPESGKDKKETGFMGPPQDWIDRFSRHFRPSRHTHLEGNAVDEMLPWLKLSAELDPQRVQSYMVTDYWLRALGKSNEAEDFVRLGLRANPRSPDLLFALGQIYFEDRKDYFRAKNLFIAAKNAWHKRDDSKPAISKNGEETKDYLLLERTLGGLIKLEETTGHPEEAVHYLQELKPDAADPEGVQKRIDELQAKIKAQSGVTR